MCYEAKENGLLLRELESSFLDAKIMNVNKLRMHRNRCVQSELKRSASLEEIVQLFDYKTKNLERSNNVRKQAKHTHQHAGQA